MKNKNKLFILGTLIFSIVSYYIDDHFGGRIFTFLSSNTISKILTIFLTLGGIISLFHPFTIKKELSKTDISKISKNTYEASKEEEKRNQRLEDQATF